MLEELVGRCAELLLNTARANRMGKGGVVLELAELPRARRAAQVGAGGEGLAQLDEAGPQVGEGVRCVSPPVL